MELNGLLQTIKKRKTIDPFYYMVSNDILQVSHMKVYYDEDKTLMLLDPSNKWVLRNSRFIQNPFFLYDVGHQDLYQRMLDTYQRIIHEPCEVINEPVYLLSADSINYGDMYVLESVTTALYYYLFRKMSCKIISNHSWSRFPFIKEWLSVLGIADKWIETAAGTVYSFSSVTLGPSLIEFPVQNTEAYRRFVWIRDQWMTKKELASIPACVGDMYPERVVFRNMGSTKEYGTKWDSLCKQLQRHGYAVLPSENVSWADKQKIASQARVVVVAPDTTSSDIGLVLCMKSPVCQKFICLIRDPQYSSYISHPYIQAMGKYANVNVSHIEVVESSIFQPIVFEALQDC